MRGKKLISVCLVAAMAISFAACSGSPAASAEVENPIAGNRVKINQFDYGDITLQDGMYKTALDNCLDYYSDLTADDILLIYRSWAGLPVGSGRWDLDWENECIVPQLISAVARQYAYTGDPNVLEKCNQLADGLEDIGTASKHFSKCDSTYTYEKMLRAMLDLYELCGIEKGYTLAKSLVEYGIADEKLGNPKKQLGNNAPYTENEWYTMSQSLYEFAQAARKKKESATDVKRYLDYAKLYEYTEFWDIFYQDKSMYDYSPAAGMNSDYFHAYSHLNSFNSALAAYSVTGKVYYLDATKKFYDFMLKEQTLPTGGYGVHLEWLLPNEKLMEFLASYKDNSETQCNAYAATRLSNALAGYTGNGGYGNWTERAFYNMTLSSLETREGYPFYYSEYSSGGGTKHLRDDWRWGCCAGSRQLIMMEYLRSIYYNDTKNLYVNLFTNSTVSFTNESGNKIELSQASSFPESNKVKFTLKADRTEKYSLLFRKPEWMSANATFKVNGKETAHAEKDGWLVVTREWSSGDVVDLTLPMEVSFEAIESEEYGYAMFLLKEGPVVLACEAGNNETDAKKLKNYLDYKQSAKTQLKPLSAPLTYAVKANEKLVFRPYYAIGENELYYMYVSTLVSIL